MNDSRYWKDASPPCIPPGISQATPDISLLVFLGTLFVAGWIGVSMERADAQEKAKKELEKVEPKKEIEEAKTKATSEATQVEPLQEADTAPPSPSEKDNLKAPLFG